MFNSLKVRAKLLLAFGVVILFTIGISIMSLSVQNTNKNVINEVNQILGTRHVRIDNVYKKIVELDDLTFSISSGETPFTSEVYSDLQQKANELIGFTSTLKGQTSPKDTSDIKKASQEYFDSIPKFIALANKGSSEELQNFYRDVLTPNFDIVHALTYKLSNLQIDLARKIVDENSSDVPYYLTLFFSIAAIVVATLIAYLFANSIVKVLQSAVAAADEISKGNLTHEIMHKRTDEFGTLLSALESMRGKWQKLVFSIKSTADSVENNVSHVNKITDSISNKAQEAESRSLTVAAAANEMVSTTGDIANNCETAAMNAKQSNETTSSGVAAVEETIHGIQTQVENSRQDAQYVKALVDQADSIGAIVNTIDDIASQTNLLALNAAIEAARAGEAGKGFAVVADEVRALASRTSKSTQEITRMVTKIQSDANTANESMNLSLSRMNELSEKTTSVNELLQSIISQVGGVTEQISQIATAAEEQTTTTSEISENMQGITAIAQGFASEVANAQTELNKSMELLENLLSQVQSIKI